ncbi:MAG: MMPL family transporter [Kutzneria sp.]|nr:MMPL family transporter [Kutzneria sp.]
MQRFSVCPPQLVFLAQTSGSVADPDEESLGRSLASDIRRAEGVAYVESVWDSGNSRLLSGNEHAVLILVGFRGDDREVGQIAGRVATTFSGRRGDLTLTAAGPALVNRDLETRRRHDLVVAEAVATPLIGLMLFLIFGSVFAAVMPLLVGLMAIVVTLGFLRLLAAVTEVSIFALNITTSLGFALSISYSLFLVTRFRLELMAGRPVISAVSVATRITGHTIRYSALTIALCLGSLLLLPTPFFRSLAPARAPCELD